MTRLLWLAVAGVLALGAAAGGAVWYATREGEPSDGRAGLPRIADPWARPPAPPEGSPWAAPAAQAPANWPSPGASVPGAQPAHGGTAYQLPPGVPAVGALPPGVMQGPAVVPVPDDDPSAQQKAILEERKRRFNASMELMNKRAADHARAEGRPVPPPPPERDVPPRRPASSRRGTLWGE